MMKPRQGDIEPMKKEDGHCSNLENCVRVKKREIISWKPKICFIQKLQKTIFEKIFGLNNSILSFVESWLTKEQNCFLVY